MMLVAGFAIAASPAVADQVTFEGMGFNQSISYKLSGESKSNQAGELLIELEGVDKIAYCVDLRHGIKDSWTADLSPVTMFAGGKAAAFLYDTFASTVATNSQAAGLQAAIWEVIEDWGSINIFGGVFKLVDAPVVGPIAQGFLNAIPADLSGYTPQSFILESGNSPRSQHVIVPEPAAVVCLLLGLPLLLRRRAAKA